MLCPLAKYIGQWFQNLPSSSMFVKPNIFSIPNKAYCRLFYFFVVDFMISENKVWSKSFKPNFNRILINEPRNFNYTFDKLCVTIMYHDFAAKNDFLNILSEKKIAPHAYILKFICQIVFHNYWPYDALCCHGAFI